MAHSRPDRIDNCGDAMRISVATGAFIIELATDRRVQDFNQRWQATRTQVDGMFDVMLAQAKQTDVPQLEAWIPQVQARERGHFQQFVRQVLRLPEAWNTLMSDSLHLLFWQGKYSETDAKFSLPVYLRQDSPQGKMPAHDAQDIKRNIRWFYRVHVQQPPDTIHDLARDYQSWAERVTDSRSVVQNGIKQARALLDLAAANAVPRRPEK